MTLWELANGQDSMPETPSSEARLLHPPERAVRFRSARPRSRLRVPSLPMLGSQSRAWIQDSRDETPVRTNPAATDFLLTITPPPAPLPHHSRTHSLLSLSELPLRWNAPPVLGLHPPPGGTARSPVSLDPRPVGHGGGCRPRRNGFLGRIPVGAQRGRLGRDLGPAGLHERLDERGRGRIRGVGRTLLEPPIEALLESPGRTPDGRFKTGGTGTLAAMEVLERGRPGRLPCRIRLRGDPPAARPCHRERARDNRMAADPIDAESPRRMPGVGPHRPRPGPRRRQLLRHAVLEPLSRHPDHRRVGLAGCDRMGRHPLKRDHPGVVSPNRSDTQERTREPGQNRPKPA